MSLTTRGESKMKMTNDDYLELKDALDKGIEKRGLHKLLAHRARCLGKNPVKRFRWDLFYLVAELPQLTVTRFYTYLNDSHIDTALKRYVKEHPILSK
jgi:hypothetical protein